MAGIKAVMMESSVEKQTTPWAQRVADIQSFKVMDLLRRAKELEASGRDVIHMEIGEPDFSTAEPIVRAGQQALADGLTQYTPALGIQPLRQAIASFYKQRYDLDLDPARVVVTPGGSGALLLLSALLVDPGKTLMMADPAYPCNRQFLRLVEARAKLVPTEPDNGFCLTPNAVRSAWDESCAGLLLASPANPTGVVIPEADLRALCDTVRELGGHRLVDEIYHGLSYGMEAPSVLQVDDDAFVLNSFSKYFGMTGWRLGWVVAPQAAVPELEKLAQNLYISAPSMAQYAALACFEADTLAILEQRRASFAERRDYLLPALRELGMHIPFAPQGAFYIYADASALTDDTFRFCFDLLEAEGVAITPGLDFGSHHAERYIRFAYTTSMTNLQRAVERIRRFIGGRQA